MTIRWFCSAAEKKRKKRIREIPKSPRVPKPRVKKVFRGPRRPGVNPQDFQILRPFIMASCGCGMERSAASKDRSMSAINDMSNKAMASGYPPELATAWWETTGGGDGCTPKDGAYGMPICQYWESVSSREEPWSLYGLVELMNRSSAAKAWATYPGMATMSHPECTCEIWFHFPSKDGKSWIEFTVTPDDGASEQKRYKFKGSSIQGIDDFPSLNIERVRQIEEAQMLSRQSPEDLIIYGPEFDIFRRQEFEEMSTDFIKRLRSGESADGILDWVEKSPDSVAHANANRKVCVEEMSQGRVPPDEFTINPVLFLAISIMQKLSQTEEFGGKVTFKMRDYGIQIPQVEMEVGPEEAATPPVQVAPEEVVPVAPAPIPIEEVQP